MRKFSSDDQRKTWGVPPRICIDLQTPAEAAIRAAMEAVEAMGAHPALTETVNLLGRGLDTLGKYIDEAEV